MSKKTPVAFFAYNRPDHTQRALKALSKCSRIEECEFYFFADGSRNDSTHSVVDATRKVLREWATVFNANIIEQPNNLGLAKSIVTGVSKLCTQYGRVVVVEDDLVVSPDFLHYMIESLDRYEADEQVMQIAGFTLSPPADLATDTFMLPVTSTWGWATWQRAWQHFSWLPADLNAARSDNKWRARFDLNGTCTFSSMLEDRLAARNDSWGILWWYAVSWQDGLVIYPALSLVWNGGFDGSGIHCGSGDFLSQGEASGYTGSSLPPELAFPSFIGYEPAHLSQLENFFRASSASSQPTEHTVSKLSKLRMLATKLKSRMRNAIG